MKTSNMDDTSSHDEHEFDKDDDEEIDSDEAFGESDEERFSGYMFRASGSGTMHRNKRSKIGHDSDEDEEEEEEEEDEVEDEADEDEHEEDEDDLQNSSARNLGQGTSLRNKISGSRRPRMISDLIDSASNDDQNEGYITQDETDNDSQATSELDNEINDSEDGELYESNDSSSKLLANVMTLYDEEPRLSEKQGNKAHAAQQSFKLSLADVLPTIQDGRLKNSLLIKHASQVKKANMGVRGKLAVPLPKLHQNRLERIEAYKNTKETLARWVDTVKHIREADKLTFPLARNLNGELSDQVISKKLEILDNTRHTTELEVKISRILKKSQVVPEKDVLKLDDIASGIVVLPQEAQTRVAQLRMAREMLFREEVRAKRLKKIKSKAYRRTLKRDKMRVINELSASVDQDELDHERDRAIIEERMTLRHKQSRWANDLQAHGHLKWNESARNDRARMVDHANDLRARIHNDYQDEDNSSSDEGADNEELLQQLEQTDEEFHPIQRKGVFDMKFMKLGEEARKQENDRLLENLREELNNGQSNDTSGRVIEKTGKRSFDAKISDPSTTLIKAVTGEQLLDEATRIAESKKSTNNNVGKEKKIKPYRDDVPDLENPWFAIPNISKTAGRGFVLNGNSKLDSKLEINPFKGLEKNDNVSHLDTNIRDVPSVSSSDSSHTLGPGSNAPKLNHEELVKRAFAGDDVVQDFALEKRTTEENDSETSKDGKVLPGWGSWAAVGNKRRRDNNETNSIRPTTMVVPNSKKKKNNNNNAIILNQKRVKKSVKYNTQKVPFPFETRQQYERSLRFPVGQEWNTNNSYQSTITPRVLVQAGKVIEPLQTPIL